MNKQEIFDKSVSAILLQGKPSITMEDDWGGEKSMRCKYRSVDECGNTLKCAVGHLISDELYSAELEYKDVEYHMVRNALFNSGALGDSGGDWEIVQLLLHLQWAHDDAARDPDFSHAFFLGAQHVAKNHSLEFEFEQSDWM